MNKLYLYLILASYNLFLNGQSLQECIVQKNDEKAIDVKLSKYEMRSYSKFKNLQLQLDSEAKGNALITLINEAKRINKVRTRNEGGGGDDIFIPYLYSWRLTIKSFNRISREYSRQHILEEWNKQLLNDDEYTPVQIYALSQEWDRTFLTDIFWEQLKSTKNDKVVYAMCYVLYKNGVQEDERRLWKFLEKEKNTEREKRMMNASNWMRHKWRTNPEAFEPSQFPPTLE